MNELIKILSLILISSVKFVAGAPLVYLSEQYDFTFWETNIYAILGGMIGVIVFMHVSAGLILLYDKFRNWYYHSFRKHRLEKVDDNPDMNSTANIKIRYTYNGMRVPKKKIFTTRSRRIVKVWRSYGLMGVAALTPVIFSIPVGTFILTRLEKNRNKILLYMFVSITAWSLLLTSLFELLHVRNLPEIIQ